MFASNPFATLSASIPPAMMQTYVLVMIFLVAAGTLFDIWHKGSARYFFENFRKSKARAKKQVGDGELVSIAVQTAVVDVMTSGEFCNVRRRRRSLALPATTAAARLPALPSPRSGSRTPSAQW